MKVETIRVQHPDIEDGSMIINKSDYDPEVHEIIKVERVRTKPVEEVEEEVTAEEIRAAADTMDLEDDSLWTSNGSPKTNVLEKIIGKPVSAEMRDKAIEEE